jgi:hypothetical protein
MQSQMVLLFINAVTNGAAFINAVTNGAAFY